MDKIAVCIVTNPFDPLNNKEMLLWESGQSVESAAREICPALHGYDFVSSVNGLVLTPEEQLSRVLVPGDTLAFCAVPRGGGGGKAILSIIAIIAIMIIAPYAGAALQGYGGAMIGGAAAVEGAAGAILYGIGYAGVLVAGGMLISAIAPKAAVDQSAQQSESPTYTWQATGNYAYEGGALPELFGTCRIVPPRIGKFVSVEGDKQFLNLLFAVAGHRVDVQTSVRIGDQTVANYSGVKIETRPGDLVQSVIQYFDDTHTDVPIGKKLSAKLILGASIANPCVIYSPAHGFLTSDKVLIEAIVGTIGTGLLNGNTYTVGAVADADHFELSGVNSNGYVYTSSGLATIWREYRTANTLIDALGIGIGLPRGLFYMDDAGSTQQQEIRLYIEYRKVGDSAWTRITTKAVTQTTAVANRWSGGYWETTYANDDIGSGTTSWIEEIQGSITYEDHVEGDIYQPAEWVTYDYGEESYGQILTRPARQWRWMTAAVTIYVPGATIGSYALIQAAQTTPIHRMYYADALPSGQYDLRVCIGYAVPPLGNRYGNDVYFESYQEIVYDNFTYPGVALLGVKALATDQLSGGMPKIDLLATRSSVQVYNPNTGAWETKPAANPAWACYYLLNREGKGVPAERIIWQEFKNWADYCDELVNGKPRHTVNIYLDQIQSLRKQLNTVGLLGRGVVVQMGSKFTCIVDRAVTVTQKFSFGMGNIVKGSYQEEFVPMDDRANAVEVTFFDSEAENQRATVEIYSPGYDNTDREINKAAVTLFGCVDRDEAIRHGKFLLNSNRYLTMTAAWEADVDAICCMPGDLVDVSHDLPQYGFSGRFAAVSRNMILRFSELNDWTDVGTTTATNNTRSPDGELTAERVTETAVNEYHEITKSVAGVPDNEVWVYSVYVKHASGSRTIAPLVFAHNYEYASLEYTPSTGVLGAGYGLALVSYGKQDCADGWVRLWVAFHTRVAGDPGITLSIRLQPYLYTGDGTSGFYVWGAQLEPGVVPTEVVPTGGVPLDAIMLDRPVLLDAGKTYQVTVRHQDDDTRETKTVTKGIGVTLHTDKQGGSPGTIGNVTFTAVVSGGPGPFEYSYLGRQSGVGGDWAVELGWSANPQWVWAAGGVSPLVYDIRVLVRAAGYPTSDWVDAYSDLIIYLDSSHPLETNLPMPPLPNTRIFTSSLFTKLPAKYTNYAFGHTTAVNKTFRVARISRAQDMTRRISGIEYNPLVYSDSGVVGIVENPSDLGVMGSLTATEIYTGGSDTKVALRWTGLASTYRIWIRRGTGSLQDLGTAFGSEKLITGLEYGPVYTFYVSGTDTPVGGKSVQITLVGKTLPPMDVPSITATLQTFGILLSWAPVTDFDFDHYEIRVGASWAAGTILDRVYTTTFRWNIQSYGVYTFWIKAVDAFGNVSVNAATVQSGVDAPSGYFVYADLLAGTDTLIFRWDAAQSPFAISHYELRYGASWAGGTVVGTTKSTIFHHRANWLVAGEPARTFRLRAYDVAGNEGPEAITVVSVVSPGAVQSLSSQVLLNQVKLSWSAPAYSYWRLPIAYYEVRKGTVFSSAAVVGRQAGTFVAVNESVGGTATYWVAAVDVAGNIGPEGSQTVTFSGPDNFTLVQTWPSSFDQAFVNAILENGSVLMPVDQTETYQQHFDHQSKTTWQGMIDAGWDAWLEDTPNSGSYAEIKDYGSTIVNQTSIRVDKNYTVLSGSPVVTCKIEVSLNSDMSGGTTYNDVWQAYATNFRYVRVTFTVTASGGDDNVRLDSMTTTLDFRMISDQGIQSVNSGDAGGTVTNWTTGIVFSVVQGIALTPQGSTASYASFEYVAGSDHFHIYLFNTSGTRISGTVAWVARGV